MKRKASKKYSLNDVRIGSKIPDHELDNYLIHQASPEEQNWAWASSAEDCGCTMDEYIENEWGKVFDEIRKAYTVTDDDEVNKIAIRLAWAFTDAWEYEKRGY